MQSTRVVLWALTALLFTGLPLSVGCEDDAPTGKIKPDKVEVKVGETAHMELLLATKHDSVQREVWKVEPGEIGEVYFDQASPRRRKASFSGKAAGKGKIVVHGLYGKATKRYRIAEVPVTVQ